ncbi:MAG: hypothetical protein KBC56_08975 [Flavobacterium sp.]|nr:hypothetical protein [Flavobacterium sp.]
MKKITDNFLPHEVFEELQKYVSENEFQIVTVGEKDFSILNTPDWLVDKLQIEGYELILTFIRRAYKGFNDLPGIHADNIIEGRKTALASVLYINDPEGVTPNGTSFHKHIHLGSELPADASEELFNHLIMNEANDESKWELTQTVDALPNRLLTYKSNLFHNKFPNEITEGIRIVAVCFYEKN